MRFFFVFLTTLFSYGLFATPYSATPSLEDYYQGTQGLNGQQLKAKLHSIIDGQKPLRYTQSGNTDWYDGEKMDVWEALVYTDSACPEDIPRCGYIQLLYLDQTRHIDQANRGKSSHDSWDREHVWPKSRGFKKQSQDGYTDLHHLRPADRNINGAHSNYGFGMGGKMIYDKRADNSRYPSGNYLNKQQASFEPSDRAKGQVARMIFYMAVRYEKSDNQSPENMPDLILTKGNQKQSGQPSIGDLCTLLTWHREFPVSDFEKRRNNRVQQLQGNRNPFIDHAEFADTIWGKEC